jgi:prenyltransferase beta subunit
VRRGAVAATRRALALIATLALAACGGRDAASAAAAWLWQHQAADGSFRSGQYAVLRSGQAMTPFVLHALLGRDDAPPERVARALDAVRRSIDADGAIGYADSDLLEYPVYATSLGILVLVQHGDAVDRDRVQSMASWLARQQCGEAKGFTHESLAYGAFGFGARGLRPGEPGHVDLTHTRFALQALAAAGRLDATIRERADVLLANLQRPDGGFAFSPVVAAANKAGRDADGHFRAYATATADGVLALRALGAGDADPRRVRAYAWLATNASAERIGGIADQPSEPWHDALRFYHAMVLAEAWPPARALLAAMLIARQAADGSFRSTLTSAMKEDDALLATTLALHSLRCRG